MEAREVTRATGTPFCTDSSGPRGEGDDLPVEMYPAVAAHRLTRSDPSESFNLAREEFASPDLWRARQRPLAGAMWLAALALVTVGVAALITWFLVRGGGV